MINFSQCPEQAPFITQPRDISLPGYEIVPFKEAFFETKRLGYIHYLKESVEALIASIQWAIIAGDNPASEHTKAGGLIIKKLTQDSPYKIFYKEYPKDTSGNSLGTDCAYDLYRTLPNMASKLRGLKSYEEYFVKMFGDIHRALYSIFQGLETRGQLYGCIEKEIINYVSELDSYTQDLNNEINPTARLALLTGIKNDFLPVHSSFLEKVRVAASDIRSIIEPIVEYINLSSIAMSILGTVWGNTLKDEDIDGVLSAYSKQAISFNGDYSISDNGLTIQIMEGIMKYLKADKTNFEMLITKTIGTAFNELQINQRIKDTHRRLIII